MLLPPVAIVRVKKKETKPSESMKDLVHVYKFHLSMFLFSLPTIKKKNNWQQTLNSNCRNSFFLLQVLETTSRRKGLKFLNKVPRNWGKWYSKYVILLFALHIKIILFLPCFLSAAEKKVVKILNANSLVGRRHIKRGLS